MTARPLPPKPHHQSSTEPHHQQLTPEPSHHQRPQKSHHRLFPVPYGATAERPGWAELPSGLRSAVAERLGAPVLGARTATGGFTPGFAAVLDLGPAGSVFVKAASLTDQGNLADSYVAEAAILSRLPAGLPVPRPRWTMTAAGYLVLCLDAVDGRIPALPWTPTALAAALGAYAEVAAALDPAPADLAELGLPTLSELAREDLSWWREIRSGREPRPELPPVAASRLDELAALEAALPRYADTVGLLHGDLRVDNILVDRAGRAWICDWTWLCRGPAWFDLAGLLLTAYPSAPDVDLIFRDHPAAAGAPADALDATLAALAGYYLVQAGAGPAFAAPHVRSHHRWSGRVALEWLARRQGWS